MSRRSKIIALPFLLMFLILLFFYREKWGSGGIFEKIKVDVYSSAVIVPIIIEGKTYNFQLDTGAPTGISQELYSDLCLNSLDSVSATDYYGNNSWVHRTILPRIQIGNSTFSGINSGIVKPIQSLFLCDKKIDGYLGSDFFHDKMLMINLKEEEVIITNDRSKLPVRRQDALKMELIGEQLAPMIHIQVNDNIAEAVLFDTGSSNHFYHPQYYAVNQRLQDGLIDVTDIVDTVYTSSGRSLFGPQNDSINFLVRYDTIRIGKLNFTNYVASTYSSAITSSYTSVLGAKSLQKGVVVLDYKYKHFYFTPYSSTSLDFARGSDFYLAYESGKWYTHAVKLGSSAYAQQIRDGFLLKQLNDIQFEPFTDCALLKLDWVFERSKQEVHYLFEFEGQEYCFNEFKDL